MEELKVKKFGPSCGKHGSSVFYKAFKYKKDGNNKIISLGQFFFMKIFDSIPVCIAELQLVWEDKHSSTDLASVRLYFLPECTPEGRQLTHGEDEVLAYYEKIVLKLSDLASLIVHDVAWSEGRTAFTARDYPTEHEYKDLAEAFSMNSFGLDNRDIEKEKSTAGDGKQTGDDDISPEVMVMSYARYCRYRCMLKRLENCEDKWLRQALVCAIGGFSASKMNNRVYFCRATFEHADLDDFELRCDHLAPNLKGRPKTKKLSSKRENGNDSSEESNCSSSFSSQTDGAATNKVRTGSRATPLRNGFRIDKVKVSKDEQAFLIDLHKFMKGRNTPIGRIPSLGFKQIDLFQFYVLAEEIGGYEQITAKRLWKNIYDALGGSAGSTSAATYTRRHYEKLLLPYERCRASQETRSLHHHGHHHHHHSHHHHHGHHHQLQLQHLKKKKHRFENQSVSAGRVPSDERKHSLDDNGDSEHKVKDGALMKSPPTGALSRPLLKAAPASALPRPLSNGSQALMSKDIASLTDRALIIKQEIEKMKMRKDAKKLASKEVHVDKTVAPGKLLNTVAKEDKAAEVCDNKAPVSSLIDNRKKKLGEKGRRPSGGQKTVRELLHQNVQEPKDHTANPSTERGDVSEQKAKLPGDTEHRSHVTSRCLETRLNPSVNSEKTELKMPHMLPGYSSHSDTRPLQQPLLPSFSPARPMFYQPLVPITAAMTPMNLPFMLPQFGFQPMGAQVQQLPALAPGNPVSVKEEKPLHALNKFVSSHSEHSGSTSKSSGHHSSQSSQNRHNSFNSTISPPSAHSSVGKYPSTSQTSTFVGHKSDLAHRSITPAHTNSSKRQYPYQDKNSHNYPPIDVKHEPNINKDVKRQKTHGSQNTYQASSNESEMPVLDLSMKTLKAQEARHHRGESLLFNTSFSNDSKFLPKSELHDVPQDLSVKSRMSSYGDGDRLSSSHKGVPLNIPHPMQSMAAMAMKKEESNKPERADLVSQAGSKLFPNAVTSIGGLPIDLASFVHPAFPQQMLMQGAFPTPLQLQQMIQGQVATGMPFMRPDIVQTPMLFPPGMSAISPAMFSSVPQSAVKSSASNSVPSKR